MAWRRGRKRRFSKKRKLRNLGKKLVRKGKKLMKIGYRM